MKIYNQIVKGLATKTFFWFVWCLSVVQAGWIAISSRYPMAFDEAYHLEIIKLHSKMLSPIFLQQPEGPATYGALVRDPSFIHHYLLSIPWRLFEYLGFSEFTSVVSLRFINIAMFAGGLFLFWKLLSYTKASRAAINVSLFFFIMIPTVPLLAGQINYDNLQFLLLPLTLIYSVKFLRNLNKNKFDATSLFLSVSLAVIGSLNKFTFLPFLTAIVVWYLIAIILKLKSGKLKIGKLKKQWLAISTGVRYSLVTLFVASSSLFVWFYGVNIVVHQNVVAQCGEVLGEDRCQTYGPWARNHRYAQQERKVDPNPIKYTIGWVGGMHYRLFFTINGSTGPKLYSNNTAPVVTATAAVIGLVGLILFLKYIRKIIKDEPMLSFMLFVTAIYVISVWGRNYHDFLQLGQNVAINGRYLQPILPIVILAFMAGYQRQLFRAPIIKLSLLSVSFILFLSGGGITGLIHYSSADWYWEGNSFVINANEYLKRIVAPLFVWK
ncbi:hypothetical protein KC946_01720 [Candidatus Saccharibacteria bacterium]|nr:hypothetical protein [Candidatus Saccharibacteria bacterium]